MGFCTAVAAVVVVASEVMRNTDWESTVPDRRMVGDRRLESRN